LSDRGIIVADRANIVTRGGLSGALRSLIITITSVSHGDGELLFPPRRGVSFLGRKRARRDGRDTRSRRFYDRAEILRSRDSVRDSVREQRAARIGKTGLDRGSIKSLRARDSGARKPVWPVSPIGSSSRKKLRDGGHGRGEGRGEKKKDRGSGLAASAPSDRGFVQSRSHS